MNVLWSVVQSLCNCVQIERLGFYSSSTLKTFSWKLLKTGYVKLLLCQFIIYRSVKTVLRQSNLKFRPEKPGIISISLTLACSILKSLFRFNITCYMSWWRWMVSDSNKFVLIRSEGRGSVGKQLVLRTASAYQLLVKKRSWLHWDCLLKWLGCTATTRCSVIVGMQITSINETAGFTYCRIPGVCNLYYRRAERN